MMHTGISYAVVRLPTMRTIVSSCFISFGAGLWYSACMYLAAPPLSWWWLSLVAMVPLTWVGLRPGGRAVRDALLVVLGAVPYWAGTQWWVRDISDFGVYPLILVLTLFVGAFVWLLRIVRERLPFVPSVLAVPFLWTGLEFIRGEFAFGGYAWGFVVHPLIDMPGVPKLASLAGVYLVSALLGGLVGAVCEPLARTSGLAVRARRWVNAGALLCGLSILAIAFSRSEPEPGPAVAVAVVQTNIPQDNKIAWTIEQEVAAMARFEGLTRQAARSGPAVIVWPETMMPGLTLEPEALAVLRREGVYFRVRTPGGEEALEADAFAARLFDLGREVGVPMLVGEEAWLGLEVRREGDGIDLHARRKHNSVYLLQDGRLAPSRYDKIDLTPFGEYIPYLRHWPGAQQFVLDVAARGMRFDFSPGHDRTVFAIPASSGRSVRVVTPICFEITVASLCRSLVYEEGQRRADMIVNLTNDGWFGKSDRGRAQHLQIARWRAAELGTPIVRAANTGISAFIDARGRLLRQGVDGHKNIACVEGVLAGTVEPVLAITPYAHIGDAVGWGCLLGGMGLLAWAVFQGAPKV
jgi:apolipoprotein N-acyltransferase